jgi:1-acyl-sn-glycerol-3-phosphate acyltransferase
LIRALCNVLVFAVVTILLALVAIVSGLWDRSGDTVVRMAQLWSRLVLRAAGVKLVLRRVPVLDPKRPYVFMSNHSSASDIWALFVAIPFPVRFIAKKQLAKVPFVGWAMRVGRFIFIDRQNPTAARRSIDEAARRIHEGTSVMIFPEGTRTRDGKLGPFKKGGFHLAVDSGADIVPVGIRGSREVMPKGAMLIRRGEITVEMGEPIRTEGITNAERLALIERVREIVLSFTGQEDAAPSETGARAGSQ